VGKFSSALSFSKMGISEHARRVSVGGAWPRFWPLGSAQSMSLTLQLCLRVLIPVGSHGWTGCKYLLSTEHPGSSHHSGGCMSLEIPSHSHCVHFRAEPSVLEDDLGRGLRDERPCDSPNCRGAGLRVREVCAHQTRSACTVIPFYRPWGTERESLVV
jgi:hypothetical protein